jgi:hypothetical protein
MNRSRRLLLVEYTGPETMEMIYTSMERAHIPPENIAVLSPPDAEGSEEAEEHGYFLLKHPFQVEDLVNWIAAREKRCIREAV